MEPAERDGLRSGARFLDQPSAARRSVYALARRHLLGLKAVTPASSRPAGSRRYIVKAMSCPVIDAAESPRRKAIVSVTRSSGTKRSRGVDLRPVGVSSEDGNSAFTVIFRGCNSLARTSMYAFSADF